MIFSERELQDLKDEDSEDETLLGKQAETPQQQPVRLPISLPSSPISQVRTRPNLPKKHTNSSHFNRGSALKIVAIILLSLIGVGLTITGIGSCVGLPLLITLSLPFFAQFLLLMGAAMSFSASAAIGIYTACPTRKASHNRPKNSVDYPSDDPNEQNSSRVISGHTPHMIKRFNQIPPLLSAQQKEGDTLSEIHPTFPSLIPLPQEIRNRRKPKEPKTSQQSFPAHNPSTTNNIR